MNILQVVIAITGLALGFLLRSYFPTKEVPVPDLGHTFYLLYSSFGKWWTIRFWAKRVAVMLLVVVYIALVIIISR